MANKNIKGVSCKPQFIRVMDLDFMEKMMIPMNYVKQHVTGEYMNSQMAVVLSPLGKFWQVKLQLDQSGMFFSNNWSDFVAFHAISEGDVLLIRYEGNMVFKVTAFGLSGSKKCFKNQDSRVQQQDSGKKLEANCPIFSGKRKRNYHKPYCEENKGSNGFITSLNKVSSQKNSDYQTGPPSWITKKLTTYSLKRFLPLPVKFCRYIGFQKSCTITLKTQMNNTRSWKVHGLVYKNTCYLGDGWKIFCKDNSLKEGDICAFNIVKAMLWQVTIMQLTDKQEQQKSSPSHSDMEYMSKNDSLRVEGKGPDGSRASFKKTYTRSIYEIGPPSWIQKDMTTCSLQQHLYLAQAFFIGIGLQCPCTITFKTSIRSAKSWQVDVLYNMNGSYKLGKDWLKFCQDNRLKEGDTCTFKVVETTLWQVVITRR